MKSLIVLVCSFLTVPAFATDCHNQVQQVRVQKQVVQRFVEVPTVQFVEEVEYVPVVKQRVVVQEVQKVQVQKVRNVQQRSVTRQRLVQRSR